jgi:hypothetical protein
LHSQCGFENSADIYVCATLGPLTSSYLPLSILDFNSLTLSPSPGILKIPSLAVPPSARIASARKGRITGTLSVGCERFWRSMICSSDSPYTEG